MECDILVSIYLINHLRMSEYSKELKNQKKKKIYHTKKVCVRKEVNRKKKTLNNEFKKRFQENVYS